MLYTILVIILILWLLGAVGGPYVGGWPYGYGYGHGGAWGVPVVLIVLLLILLLR